jgi:hypothetical protein
MDGRLARAESRQDKRGAKERRLQAGGRGEERSGGKWSEME